MTHLIPNHLKENSAQGLTLSESIAQFEIGDYKNLVYLILDWQSKQAAIVDPQTDLSAPLQALSENGFKLTAVLLTHSHWDHIAGVPELQIKYPSLPIYVHELDARRLEASPSIHWIKNQDVIQVGTLPVRVLHTPGHSSGECCFLLEKTSPPFLLTGDTVFIRDCGRTDLESGSSSQMFNSLQEIKKLAPSTIILPGHHYAKECASTLEQELISSPPMKCLNTEELEKLP